MEQKNINELTITGKCYQVKHPKETMTTFSIGLYAGKQADNKPKIGFIKCTCFFNVDLQDKQPVCISGKLRAECYTNKEGKEISSPVIICDMVNGIGGELKSNFPNAKVVEHTKSKQDAFVSDKDENCIPF